MLSFQTGRLADRLGYQRVFTVMVLAASVVLALAIALRAPRRNPSPDECRSLIDPMAPMHK